MRQFDQIKPQTFQFFPGSRSENLIQSIFLLYSQENEDLIARTILLEVEKRRFGQTSWWLGASSSPNNLWLWRPSNDFMRFTDWIPTQRNITEPSCSVTYSPLLFYLAAQRDSTPQDTGFWSVHPSVPLKPPSDLQAFPPFPRANPFSQGSLFIYILGHRRSRRKRFPLAERRVFRQ